MQNKRELLRKWMPHITRLQNHPANVNQDHCTICGFFDREEQYVDHYAKLADRARRYDEENKS